MANALLDSVRGPMPISIDDIFLKERKVFLIGQVNDESVNNLIKELLYLEVEDDRRPITLFINSPGGEVLSGLSAYDTIRMLKSPIIGVAMGLVASMGSVIYLGCEPENRLMLPNSKIMIHDCSWSRHEMGGKKPGEIQEELNQLKDMNERLISIIAERTGKSVDEIAEVTCVDSYYTSDEAISFGLASRIVDSDCLNGLMKKGA